MNRLWLSAVALCTLAACSSSATPAAPTSRPAPSSSTAPRMVPVRGSMSLTSAESWVPLGRLESGARCRADSGYDDVGPGAEVVVSDDSGRTLAITALGRGHISAAFDCLFRFRASVPAGRGFYGVQVTHRGVVKEPESALGAVALSLG